jgi:hypothetical protein
MPKAAHFNMARGPLKKGETIMKMRRKGEKINEMKFFRPVNAC